MSHLAKPEFTVSVTAKNQLGNSSSFPFTFTFLDIGKFDCSFPGVVYWHMKISLKLTEVFLCVAILKETGADGKVAIGTKFEAIVLRVIGTLVFFKSSKCCPHIHYLVKMRLG